MLKLVSPVPIVVELGIDTADYSSVGTSENKMTLLS